MRLLPTLAPAVGAFLGGMLGLGRGDGGGDPHRARPRPGHAVQQADHAAPPGGVPQRGPGQVKAVKNAFGVSVNDVVMAMCAGALRRWLADHDALPARAADLDDPGVDP